MTPDRWADLRARAEAHVAAVIALDEAKKARKRHIELIALDAVRVAAEEFDEAADPATVLALLAERDALLTVLQATYATLCKHPMDGWRARNQAALCLLREAIADAAGRSSEDVQTEAEDAP